MLRILFFVSVCLVSALALAQTASTIGVDQLRPGMRGYGLTVLRGTQPERFEVELIDVLKNFRPGQDLLLIRTPHPRLDTTRSVAGMSGSPVYFEGKLAGAYAYGWPFGLEPIAGVTPIANMLAELHRPLDPEVWHRLGTQPALLQSPLARNRPAAHARRRPGAAQFAGLPPHRAGQPADALWGLRTHAGRLRGGRLPGVGRPGVQRLQPAATPVMLSGFVPAVADLLAEQLSGVGLLAVAGGGGGGTAPPAPATGYVDGGALGVQLIRGDISATGIGTVTHVAGSRLLAFGHPMMNVGQTALPTCTARILHVLASERSSFKMGEPIAPLGALVHDRQATIVVDNQVVADTVPVTLRVHGMEGAPKTTWEYEVVSQRALTPALVFAGMVNALKATAVDATDVMFRADARVEIEGHGTLSIRDEGYAEAGVASPTALAGLRMFRAMEAAYGNPFEVARVLGVEIDLHLRFGDEIARIAELSAPFTEVDPDSDVTLQVRLRRFGRPDELRPVQVHIPQAAAGEKVVIEVAAGDEVPVEQPKPQALQDLLDGILQSDKATTLLSSVSLPSRGLRMRGHVVHRLPGSVLDMLQGEGQTDPPAAFTSYRRARHPFGVVLSGRAKIKLDVRQEPRR